LKGRDEPVRQSAIHHSIRGRFAIRKGSWKLELCAGSGGWGNPSDKEARQQSWPQVQLYHMERDIHEKNNLEEKRPRIVSDLVDLLQNHVSLGRSTPGPPQANDVEVDIWKEAREAKVRLIQQEK
jgi:hypothetical protein